MPGKLEQNGLRKMNLIIVAADNIDHEVTKKKAKPSHAGKTRANAYGMKFINVAETNMGTR